MKIPETTKERKGIQAVVTLKANGNKRADVKIGQKVKLIATIEVPEKMGKLVTAVWNFEGLPSDFFANRDFQGWNFESSDAFPVKATFKKGNKVTIATTYTFTKAGTYFPTLRVTSQREGDAKTPFARIQNLDRVRVVVK